MSASRAPLRFAVVGVANTAIDFGLLFLLTAQGTPVLLANTISTGISFAFSFFMNRHFTFRATTGSLRRQMIAFVAVTLAALWLLQPAVIWLVTQVSDRAAPTANAALILLIAKVIATVASMTWNYLLYTSVVFRTAGAPTADAGGVQPARPIGQPQPPKQSEPR